MEKVAVAENGAGGRTLTAFLGLVGSEPLGIAAAHHMECDGYSRHQTPHQPEDSDPKTGHPNPNAPLLGKPPSCFLLPRSQFTEPPSLSSVILLRAEGEVAGTIRPRLEAYGADLRSIVKSRSVRQDGTNDRRASCSSFSHIFARPHLATFAEQFGNLREISEENGRFGGNVRVNPGDNAPQPLLIRAPRVPLL